MPAEKVKSLVALKRIVKAAQRRGRKVVFTNGCFDLLHWGHVQYLAEARKKGDLLVVAVNSDESVRRLKGSGRPVTPGKDRARVLAGLAAVDYVVIFPDDTPERVIRELSPDVLVKGGDWKKNRIVGRDWVEAHGGRVETIRFLRGYSTSSILKTAVGRGGRKK